MTTYYLLTRNQRSEVSPERVSRLRRTQGARWVIVRDGDGEYGVGSEELEGEMREWWDQAAAATASGGTAVGQR